MKTNGNENITVGNSEFTNTYFNATNMTKYVDKYTYGTTGSTFNRYIKGDATKETLKTWADGTNSWYGDYSTFINSSDSWFYRGGYFASSTEVGILLLLQKLVFLVLTYIIVVQQVLLLLSA